MQGIGHRCQLKLHAADDRVLVHGGQDDAASYHGHEEQCRLASHAEGIYEVGFSGTSECLFMDLAHRRIIIWSLPTDAQHGAIVLQDVSDDGAGLLPPL
jgi:hypothetical protein